MIRYLLPVTLFAGLLLLLGVGLRLNPREVPSPFIGKAAPAFDAARLDDAGARVRSADMAGKVWVLNVWASWCGACRDEHPLLVEFAARREAMVVGLNYKDEREAGLHWLRRHGDPFAVSAFDPEGRIGLNFGVYGVPETFIIDRAGKVRYKHIGPLTRQVLDQKIRPLIRELNRA